MTANLEVDVKEQEVIAPEQEEQHEPQAEVHPEPIPEHPKEDLQDKNWRAARYKMEEQSHQIQLLQNELDSIRRSQTPAAKEPEEEEFLTDSERSLNKKIKDLQSLVQKNQAKETDYVIERLKSKFPDFDEVMSPDNITYLRQNNPALAKAIASLKDEPYEQGLAAYEALRHTQWYKQKDSMKDKEKIEQNQKKPVSVQSVRKQGALADANRFVNGLTPELKKALQKEMADARKGA